MFSVLAATVLLSACALKKSGSFVTGGACSIELFSGSQAFQLSLYPVLRNNVTCTGCHNSNPSANRSASPFSDPNLLIAYAAAKDRVDFSSVEDSELLYKIEQENHNCGTVAQCNALGALVRENIKKWWDKGENPKAVLCGTAGGGNNGGGGNVGGGGDDPVPPVGPTYKTAPLAVPANLSKTVDTLITFDLSSAASALAGSHLRVGLRRILDASASTLGTFSARDPRLATSSKKYRITNIQVVVNDSRTPYLNWVGVDFTVAPQAYTPGAATWPFFRMSTRPQDMLFDTTADTIRIAFDIEESTGTPSPDPGVTQSPEQVLFNTQVSPLLTQKCAACHGAARPFSLAGSIDQDRVEAQSFASRAQAANSQLYVKAIGNGGHSGGNALPAQADRTIFLNWFASLPN